MNISNEKALELKIWTVTEDHMEDFLIVINRICKKLIKEGFKEENDLIISVVGCFITQMTGVCCDMDPQKDILRLLKMLVNEHSKKENK
jgi:hypothetical protein